LNGGADNDVLFGGSGVDFFFGGDGNDTFFIDEENEVVSGGSGTDVARINSQSGITVTMAGWTGVERVDGAAGNDTISAMGQTASLLLTGGAEMIRLWRLHRLNTTGR
jgi:Ca2+-binding RTX toxin-like protein